MCCNASSAVRGGCLSGATVARVARRLAAPLALLAGGAFASAAPATVIRERTVPVASAPAGIADGSSAEPALSASGRVVAFASTATNLGPRDPNGAVRDVYTASVPRRATRLVSLAVDGAGANGASGSPALSADGAIVAFTSSALNLVFGDHNGVDDVFVREGGGVARLVSLATDGSQANGPSGQPAISGDGRYVAFTSAATNLVAGGGLGTQVYLHDLVTQTTVRIERRPRGTRGGSGASGGGDQRRRPGDQLRLRGEEPRRGRYERRPRRFVVDSPGRRHRARQRRDDRRSSRTRPSRRRSRCPR